MLCVSYAGPMLTREKSCWRCRERFSGSAVTPCTLHSGECAGCGACEWECVCCDDDEPQTAAIAPDATL